MMASSKQQNTPVTKLTYQGVEGIRLDTFVAHALPQLSRSRVQALIEQAQVLVNQRTTTKASTRLAPGDEISLLETTTPPRAALSPGEPEISIEVLFEDEELLVVNKPPGLAVHPAPGYTGQTLVDILLARNSILANSPTTVEGRWPGIVHRLDKDTSGLLLVAKTPQAMMLLPRQFQERTVIKRYLALVEGQLPLKEGAIEAPIGRDQRKRNRMAVVAQHGRSAQTLFWVEQPFARFTLVCVQILTGRTHQIRVHFAAIGHPVAGDHLYGPDQQPQPPRMFLHATELRFRHPTTGQEMAFTAPLPADLQDFLKTLST